MFEQYPPRCCSSSYFVFYHSSSMASMRSETKSRAKDSVFASPHGDGTHFCLYSWFSNMCSQMSPLQHLWGAVHGHSVFLQPLGCSHDSPPPCTSSNINNNMVVNTRTTMLFVDAAIFDRLK